MDQVGVTVLDTSGYPLRNTLVSIYRTVPYSLVKSTYTDSNGYAGFNGLWAYNYCLGGENSESDLNTPPAMFNVGLDGKAYPHSQYTLKATPPPHEYEHRIKLGIFAGLGEWLVESWYALVEAVTGNGGEFEDAWVEYDTLVVKFSVTESPFPWLIIGAILALLILLVIAGWTIMEILKKIGEIIPEEYVGPILIGIVAVAGVGAAALLIDAIKK